jgi:AAA+ ATPase superfamily predicted ATPase
MKPRQYFPLGKAYGEAFCNRVDETNKLMGNIKNGKHTFLVAPRRYGKSSLCEKVLELIEFPWVKLDFHLAMGEKDAERIIVNGITELIGKSIGSIEKLTSLIKKYAKKLKPKLNIGTKIFSLDLELSHDSTPGENIAEAMLILDKLLTEKKKQAVLILDEFQEIGLLKQGKGMEGAIRHAAQELDSLSLIFSGSNPHLLRNMFEDERRPLYKLCRKLVLDRISEEHYKEHLNKAAKIMWKNNLDDQVFNKIMLATERHPYYVNYLCDELWAESEKIPSLESVERAWITVVEEERSDLLKDFSSLSDNQKKIMVYLSNYSGDNLYSDEAATKMDMPVSSISRAVSTLIEKDYVEKTKEGYRLIVPAFKMLLAVAK